MKNSNIFLLLLFTLLIFSSCFKDDEPTTCVEGLSIGTSISREGTYFNLVFTPTKVGIRKTIIIIRHDTGELAMYLSGKGI
ncbi:hypothetical protein EI424_11920 [Tenacibaculum singaporense]|nr:hypothetical protein EI424_11920 [Tenacibaculum singaporense]